MSRIMIPSSGPDSWRQFLAKPNLHWVTGKSARTMAHSWEGSAGLPKEIAALLEPVLGPVRPLIVIPEHKTPLPGGSTESQSDALLLARAESGLLTATIEGKVDESFDRTVDRWLGEPRPGKQARLDYLCDRLGLSSCPGDVHYQLVHRTVAALIEADNFDAAHAAMIVHSFSPEHRWFDEFARFVALLGGEATVGRASVVEVPGRKLILGWAPGDQQFRSR